MKKNITFDSRLDNISIVEKLIDEVSEKYKINDTIYGNILVSLVEAVNNAIKHGNKLDLSKKVDLYIEVDGNTLLCRITDEGIGFNYKNVPDPTTPENIDKPHGRGVFLMLKLTDNLEFKNDGRQVEMQFVL